VSGAGGIIFDHAAQTHDEVVDGATGDIGGVFPDFGLQSGSRQNDSVIFQKVSEQFLFASGERVNFFAVSQFEATKVHSDIAESHDILGRANGASVNLSASFIQQIADATEQFGQ
jgi:hypothetical protein